MRLSTALLFLTVIGANAQPTVGLLEITPANLDGYVLFAPIPSNNTWLIDKCGQQVHTWTSAYKPGDAVYLLETGQLLRTGSTNNADFVSGGRGGAIQLLDGASNVLWEVLISDAQRCQHHDVRALPNGNVLAIVWEKKTVAQAMAAGRDPALLGTELWTEAILELQPISTDSATVVWQWHLWDHLVQAFDALQPNFGVVGDHPELVNLNYLGGPPTQADWIHANALDYNADLDQIILSAHNMDEFWVIDHGTTTSEAASHSGGAHGRGGDLLYRWGNPQVYDRGTAADQKLYAQHNAHWIPNGLPDAGMILIFNNGVGRPGGNYSSVDMIAPPVDAGGDYSISPGAAYGPAVLTWTWSDTPPADFYSNNISGAQRLPNGGTMVCEGNKGEFFELDSAGAVVWKYINPVGNTGPMTQGATPANNPVFRCTWFDPAYPGLASLALAPAGEIELDPLVPSLCVLLGEAELMQGEGFTIAPNPVHDHVTIQLEDASPVEVTLADALGRVVITHMVQGGSTSLDLGGIPSGVYTITAESGSDRWCRRFVVE